jgi:ribonuclease D
MSQHVITGDDELIRALDTLPKEGFIAIDTEFMRRNTFYPQVALLQLYGGGEALLVDPLALDDLSALRALMSDRSRVKILHSGSEDLEVFSCWLGVLPEPLVDTQRAAALLGEDYGLGYRALVQRFLGVELDKGETRSDWLQRPLTPSQLHYAAQDVLHLLPVWELLAERAEASNRMAWVQEESEELRHAMVEREREPYRRIKGAGKLSARQLAVLAALSEWRERRARSSDKPRGWILDDKACLALAREMPQDHSTLAALDVVPQGLLRRQGDDILQRISAAAALPDDELPAIFPPALSSEQRQRLKSLKVNVRELAEELGVAPEILMSSADLELLLRESAGAEIAVPRRWAGWREEAVVTPLRKVLL